MALTLTRRDCEFIANLVAGVTENSNESLKTFTEIIAAYAHYGEDAEIGENRHGYFESTFTRLLNNLVYAGRESAEVFIECRDQIILMFTRLGIPVADLEEMADEAISRFWRFQYAEKYNPLRSSWSHYLYTALSRMKSTYWNKQNRTPTAMGFSYQHYETESEEGCSLEPYEVDDGFLSGPDACLMLEEILQDFEEFLSRFQMQEVKYKKFDGKAGGIRTFKTLGFPILDDEGKVVEVIPVEKKNGIVSRYKKICTLIPPVNGLNRSGGKWLGTKNVQITEPTTAYFIRQGTKTSRVELDGWSILWDEANIDNVIDNPDTSPRKERVVERSLILLYKMLIEQNAQADVIASTLKIGDSTVHAWVRTLERLFAEWWKISPLVPSAQKWMASPQQVCRGCGWEHSELPAKSSQWAYRNDVMGKIEIVACTPDHPEAEQVEGHWCDLCLSSLMDNVPERFVLPFPWGRVRASQRLVDKSLRAPNSSPVRVYSL